MQYLIGIDSGTSNTKAVAITPGGEMIGEASAAYSALPARGDGFHEHDPEMLFGAAMQVLNSLINHLRDHQLIGISFSSAMHGLMALDINGKPLTNLMTWADLRSRAYAKKIREENRAERLAWRTGTPVHPMSPLCKLIWLRENQPAVFRQSAKFISIKEYIFFKLTGQYLIDHSLASATGLFDIYTLNWNEEALELAGIRESQLSVPVGTGSVITEINAGFLNLTGISGKIPFIIGASDGCLANLGSHALGEGDVSVTIGTSGAVRMTGSKPFDSSGRLFNYILNDKLYISGGPLNNAGNLLKWYAENFLNRVFVESSDFKWFVDTALKAPPGSDGLVFLPYVNGERSPVWNADAKAMFFGIKAIHNQSHFMRAIVEGICFALYQVLNQLETSIGPAKNIMASGGFIKSPEWVKILASVFNKPVKLLNSSDASSVGAVILGYNALGVINDLDEAAHFFGDPVVIMPNEEDHAIYLKNFRIYNALYPAVQDLFDTN